MSRRRLGVLAALLLGRLCWVAACSSPDDEADQRSRLSYLTQRLTAEAAPGWGPSEFYAGEWRIVSLSMTALAAVDLNEPAQVEKLAEVALRRSSRAFDTGSYRTDALATLGSDEGHAGYLGHLMLVLASECSMGSTKHRAEADAVSTALRARFLAAQHGLIDTYAGRKWIPDNAAALAGVELYARCRGLPSFAVVARRWPTDATGLLLFSPGVAPRGSGAAWNSIYLPRIDAEFAQQQFRLASQRFAVHPAPGLAAFREYPPGVRGTGDADSGPLVFGLSPSATGFALAGADDPLRGGLLRTAELAGWTVPWHGRHYLFGPLVGDAAVLAARTSGRRLPSPGARAGPLDLQAANPEEL